MWPPPGTSGGLNELTSMKCSAWYLAVADMCSESCVWVCAAPGGCRWGRALPVSKKDAERLSQGLWGRDTSLGF